MGKLEENITKKRNELEFELDLDELRKTRDKSNLNAVLVQMLQSFNEINTFNLKKNVLGTQVNELEQLKKKVKKAQKLAMIKITEQKVKQRMAE